MRVDRRGLVACEKGESAAPPGKAQGDTYTPRRGLHHPHARLTANSGCFMSRSTAAPLKSHSRMLPSLAATTSALSSSAADDRHTTGEPWSRTWGRGHKGCGLSARRWAGGAARRMTRGMQPGAPVAPRERGAARDEDTGMRLPLVRKGVLAWLGSLTAGSPDPPQAGAPPRPPGTAARPTAAHCRPGGLRARDV